MSIEATNAAFAYQKTKMLDSPVANNNGNMMLSSLTSSMGFFNKALQDATAAYGGVIEAANETSKEERRKGRLSSFISETGKNVQDILKQSENVSAKAIVGDADISDVVATISNAEIALQSIINIRDKVISAYQDVMKMQI